MLLGGLFVFGIVVCLGVVLFKRIQQHTLDWKYRRRRRPSSPRRMAGISAHQAFSNPIYIQPVSPAPPKKRPREIPYNF